MWRSKARAFLLRSSIQRHHPIGTQVPSKTLTLIRPPLQTFCEWVFPSSTHFQNPRFFSHDSVSSELASGKEAGSGEDDGTNPSFISAEFLDLSVSETSGVGIDGDGFFGENPGSISQDGGFGENLSLHFQESDASPIISDNGVERDDALGENPSSVLEESGDSPLGFDDGTNKGDGEGESLGSLWEESVNDGDPTGIFTPEESVEETIDEIPEINIEHVENAVSVLQSTLQEPLEMSLGKMELTLSEEFMLRVLRTPHLLVENLIGFFIWAAKSNESIKTSTSIYLLIRVVSISAELAKKEAYMLWDLVKEIGKKETGLVNTEILNQLISMFWKLGKAKAGFEVFNKFDEFGCKPDEDTYYLTIEALGKRSMFDTAWSVCEKMLNSGSLPDSEKLGKIITFFCKGNRAKDAHLVYLMAKENKKNPSRSRVNFLIGGLSTKDDTIQIAKELLEDYSEESRKYAIRPFTSVIHGLCRIQDLQEAKKLLLRMVESGPPPGNTVFNFVIGALSKGGEMEDAIALMKVMESRGLRPDIYTYTVIMSGFANGGLMDEAHNIFVEAKKRHPKLSRVTYHILIRGYCKIEEFDKALECMKEMKADGVQPNTDEYNKLIQSLCLKALDWRTAEKIFEEMKENGLYLKGITRGLIAAVKQLEDEEVQSGGDSLEA